MLLSLINTLLALRGIFQPDNHYPADYGPTLSNNAEFDFIIVGAGSAGPVVANRLSENPDWKVLLLEAGGYPSRISEIPGLSFLLQDSDEDWQYVMEPSKTCCLGLQKNRCHCPRGKGLGGTSLINSMMYVRSTRYDHDRWVSEGNIGWDYDSVVKYYKKFENANDEDNVYYGSSGEVNLARYPSNQPLRKILMNGYQELGYTYYTEDTPIGFKDNLQNIHQGTRQSAASSFLTVAQNRKNLHLAVNAQVGKLLIDRQTLTVYGVEVKISNQLLHLKAKMEVVLSAGSIISPHILMHSGIGPKEHLLEFDIKSIKDLKVGENLQDHIGYPVFVRTDPSAVTPITPLQWTNEVYQYMANRKGLLSTLDLSNFYNNINTKNKTSFSDAMYVHALLYQNSPYAIQQATRCTRMPEEVQDILLANNNHSPIVLLISLLLHPKSRGAIRLQSADPYSTPLIIPNFLSDEHDQDMDTLLHSIKMLDKLLKTESLAQYHAKVIDLDLVNCRGVPKESDEYLKCAIRNLANGVYHPVGTCKMGPGSDANAVVDPQLRVHGVKGVRVIDGSIIPIATSCNTNAPIMMIGEKGAELIKEYWTQRHDEL